MRALLLLVLCAAAVLADEPQADPATRHLPADTLLVVRLAAPHRIDAIAGDLPAIAKLLDMAAPGRTLLLAVARGAPVDPTKPIYWSVGPNGAVTLLAAAPGTTADEVAALGRPDLQFLPDGWLRVSDAPAEDAGEPLALLPGDVSLVFPLAKVVEKNRAKINEALNNIDSISKEVRRGGAPVPEVAFRFGQLVGARVLRAAADCTDIQYALTWREGRLESEAWIRTREGSALRRWVEQCPRGRPTGLIGFLPSRAFWMVESAGTMAGLDGDVASLLDDVFGEGAGASLLMILSPSYALREHLTGRTAGAAVVQGMMSMGMKYIHEIKPDAKIGEAIAAIDVTRMNRILAENGIPVEAKLEQAIAKDGETEIHRLSFASPDPQVAMVCLQMQTCFAVEGRYLLVAQSAVPENDLRALLSRVRSGQPQEHPHVKAMERLMPDWQEGLSINLGTLKPVLGLIAMAAPDTAKFVNAFPDDLWLSTALAVRGGNIHIRGDWPLKESLDFAATVKALMR